MKLYNNGGTYYDHLKDSHNRGKRSWKIKVYSGLVSVTVIVLKIAFQYSTEIH